MVSLARRHASYRERALGGVAKSLGRASKRLLDIAVSSTMLLLLLPLIAIVALAIKLDSPGPVFFRARRVGLRGRELAMLKFRKMDHHSQGSALTSAADDRFTRVGTFLAATKLDELPQLWNVLKGQMSLVGPRPEDSTFVGLHGDAYDTILSVRPGMTGLCQLAFAKEGAIPVDGDRLEFYLQRLLPQKARIDEFYALNRTILMDLKILLWTFAPVLLRLDVAVNRTTGALTLRRRRQAAPVPAPDPDREAQGAAAQPASELS